MKKLSKELKEKFSKIKLLALDSDGVLTDGGVYIGDDGKEFRRFDIKDGLGLKRIMQSGIEVAIISSGTCQSVLHRARQLGIAEVHIGVSDKLELLKRICSAKQVELDEVCYMGDDLADLELMKAVGTPCCPKNAVKRIIHESRLVVSKPGGKGALRELADIICGCKL